MPGTVTSAIHSPADAAPRAALTPDDLTLHVSADGRAVLTRRGNQVPAVAERVDLETGQRTPYRTFAPADRAGALRIGAIAPSDAERSYAYAVSWMPSQLFTVGWKR